MLRYLPIIRKMGRIDKGRLIKRIISLGINPNKGGSPPKESSVRAKIILFDPVINVDDDKSFGVSIFARYIKFIRIIRWIV